MCRGRNLIWLKMTVGLGLGDVSTGIVNAEEAGYHGSYLGVCIRIQVLRSTRKF